MKRLAVMLLLCASTSYSQTYYMNIRMRGGGTTSIPILDIRKLTFSDTVVSVGNEKWGNIIKTFALLQNYPNPFNPSTTVTYRLPMSGNVEVRIFNITGQLVKTLEKDFQTQGEHRIVWDGHSNTGQTVASGPYFFQVAFENATLSKKMLFIK